MLELFYRSMTANAPCISVTVHVIQQWLPCNTHSQKEQSGRQVVSAEAVTFMKLLITASCMVASTSNFLWCYLLVGKPEHSVIVLPMVCTSSLNAVCCSLAVSWYMLCISERFQCKFCWLQMLVNACNSTENKQRFIFNALCHHSLCRYMDGSQLTGS